VAISLHVSGKLMLTVDMVHQARFVESHPESPYQSVIELLSAFYLSQAVATAAQLGVSDHLEAGDKTTAELAALTSTHAPSLYRLLRCLAAVGVYRELPGQRFCLTPVGECLRAGSEHSLRALAMMTGLAEHWRPWGALIESLRTGRPAFEIVFERNYFEHLRDEQNRDAAQIFQEAMTALSRRNAEVIADGFDFATVRTVVDVGGGRGYTLGHLLQRHVHLFGTLFDLPEVIRDAPATLARWDVTARCTLEAGDFFEVVPAGGDLYLLTNILHDWDDERAALILTQCRRAMTACSRLLVCEHVVPNSPTYHYGKLLDLAMMVITPGGKERTSSELTDLFTRASLRLCRSSVSRSSGLCLLEAVPV
jgi:hypothetical protein